MEKEYKVIVDSSEIAEIKSNQKLILDKLQSIGEALAVKPEPEPTPGNVPQGYVTLEEFGGSSVSLNNWEAFKKAFETQKPIYLYPNTNYRILGYHSLEGDLNINPALNGSSLTIGILYYNRWKNNNEESPFLVKLPEFANSRVLCDILPPEGLDQVQGYSRQLFRGSTNSGAGKVIWIGNGVEQNNVSWGMGFLYAGSKIEYDTNGNAKDFLFAAQANINHKGIGFQDMKANSGNGIFSIVRNCEVISDEDYNHVAWKVKGKFVGNRFYPENFDVDSLKADGWYNPTNWHWSIQFAHTYLICDGDIDNQTNSLGFRSVKKTATWTNANTSRLNRHEIEKDAAGNVSRKRSNVISIGKDSEYHAGNSIKINGAVYTITDKRRRSPMDRSEEVFEPNRKWDYTLDKEITGVSGSLELVENQYPHEGLIEVYLCFRGNYVDVSRLDDTFGNYNLTGMAIANCPNKPLYNHIQMGADWKDLLLEGYYRQSTNGITGNQSIGYKLNNCQGLGSIEGIPSQFTPVPQVIEHTHPKILSMVKEVELLLT